MKVRIEIDESITENEVVIRCSSIDSSIQKIQSAISNISAETKGLVFYKEDTEYYISLSKILFFETEDGKIYAHTADDMYIVKYKLYELQELLPDFFIRVSKSTILNMDKIYSISKNITASSVVQFENSYKKVYVSRSYFKTLKIKLEERRNTLWKGITFSGELFSLL